MKKGIFKPTSISISKKTPTKIWRHNKGTIIFLGLMFVFRSAIADWNTVPTGSMNPTIVEGDRILINKLAYDVRIPFTDQSIFELSNPARGEIIIFDSKIADTRLVKRVVGVPGDTVELINNELFVNDQVMTHANHEKDGDYMLMTESLFDVNYRVQKKTKGSEVDSFAKVIVPDDVYLVLGDNRDNSADSRFIGFVNREEIIGRSKYVVMSLNYDRYYLPRSERFLQKL